jgi:Fic family protein
MFCNSVKKLKATTLNRMLSTSSEIIFDASVKRKHMLNKVYLPKFKDLDTTESLKLAKSGDIWWNHSGIGDFKVELSESTLLKLSTIDTNSNALKGHVALNQSSSLVWKAFRLAMTHHSTAIEGNQLDEHESKIVIDEYAEGISKGWGISCDDMVVTQLWQYRDKDVREVVNHAAAMEHLQINLFGKTCITIDDIINVHRILVPTVGVQQSSISMRGLDDGHDHLFRRMPVHVTGSPAIRPYPHEIPAVMEKLFIRQKSSYIMSLHPVVAAVLFVTDFLHIHPFEDGNGRTARLLLALLLYNNGYFGCIIHKEQRNEYLSQFDKYFINKEADPMINFIAECVTSFLNELHDNKLDN